MELDHLRAFLAVAEANSFSKAAKICHCSQPTISLQVMELERLLEQRLFDRISTRRIQLTPAGRALRELAKPLVATFEALPNRLHEQLDGDRQPHLHIVVEETLMENLLPPYLARLKKSYPDALIQVASAAFDAIPAQVRSGEIDLAIGGRLLGSKEQRENLPTEVLFTPLPPFSRLLIIPKEHLLAKERSITFAALAAAPLILPNRRSSLRQAIESLFSRLSLSPKVTVETNSAATALTLVQQGLGIAIVDGFDAQLSNATTVVVRDATTLLGCANYGVWNLKGASMSLPGKYLALSLR